MYILIYVYIDERERESLAPDGDALARKIHTRLSLLLQINLPALAAQCVSKQLLHKGQPNNSTQDLLVPSLLLSSHA